MNDLIKKIALDRVKMEQGLERIKKLIKSNCKNDEEMFLFFNEFIEKDLYVGYFSDELKKLIEKYAPKTG